MATEQAHIDNLIAKYLAGEITPEDNLQLEHWMESSPENKKYFGDVRFVHDKTVASHKYIKVDTEKAWDNLIARMDQTPASKPKSKIIPFYKNTWLRVAASILLITGTAVIFYLLNNRNSQLPVSLALNSNDSIITHQLPDNTKVVLNRNSKISYAFNAKAKKREIILSGEAFIEVKHSEDTLMIVKTDDVFIRDIGTSFNVKAYPQSNTVEVFVESGEVLFYTSEKNSIRLQKGETGTYDKKLKTFSKLIAEDPNIIAFKTKIFVFNNTKLSDAIAALNNVYPETIILENPELSNCTITVSFNDENIGSIVDIIAETLGLQTLSSDTGYIIRGKECIYR